MIVVDSSVWIDHLRGTATPQVVKLQALICSEALIVGDVILCEVPELVPAWKLVTDKPVAAFFVHNNPDPVTMLRQVAGYMAAASPTVKR